MQRKGLRISALSGDPASGCSPLVTAKERAPGGSASPRTGEALQRGRLEPAWHNRERSLTEQSQVLPWGRMVQGVRTTYWSSPHAT